GVEKRPESAEATVQPHVAEKPSKVKKLVGTALGDLVAQGEHAKASIRAKVDYPFHAEKNLFKHRKTRYRGLAKNTAPLLTLFGLANLILARRWLLASEGKIAS
ncbi:MAG TPA: IS5/IS1182 family transposase, partial [Polyangiaceae bacterium]|nr:IS5/IS1182 family transposase [Polyangiaceae bacterium]